MANEIKLASAGTMKAGSYLLIEGNACIVRDTQYSKPGKHGHAKIRLKAVDMITGNNKEIVMPGHDNVEVPIIGKRVGQILAINGDNIDMMDMETFEQFTAYKKLADEEVRENLKAGQTVLFWDVMGKFLIKTIKEEAQ